MNTNNDQLLLRYLDGKLNAEETEEVEAFLREDGQAREFLRLAAEQAVVFADMERTSVGRDLEQRRIAQFPGSTKSANWRGVGFALAASLVLLAAVLIERRSDTETRIVTVEGPVGALRWTGGEGRVTQEIEAGQVFGGGTIETLSAQSSVALVFQDGTRVTLAGDSALTVSELRQKRLHLRHGSLSADVNPQPKGRPLLIHTPTATLEVLGTRFDVESESTATLLSVSEGRVRMTRNVDGSVVEVPAEHHVVAALNPRRDFKPERRAQSVRQWSSDLSQDSDNLEGVWTAGDEMTPPVLRAKPKLLANGRRNQGPRTIHLVSLRVPREIGPLHVAGDSTVVVKGRLRESTEIEIMLGAMGLKGGFAGNFFQRANPSPTGQWEIRLPLSSFNAWGWKHANRPLTGPLNLRKIVIYTIGTDAGLAIEEVKVLPAAPDRVAQADATK